MRRVNTYILILFSIILLDTPKISEASDSIVINGSFEEGKNPPVRTSRHRRSWYRKLETGDSSLRGWTVDKGSVDWAQSHTQFWKASDGNYSIDLSGNRAGRISQQIATERGVEYILLFDLAGNMHGEPPVKTVRVSAGSQSWTFDYDQPNENPSRPEWITKSVRFVARSNNTLLRFESLTEGAYGPIIDNVRIELADLRPPLQPTRATSTAESRQRIAPLEYTTDQEVLFDSSREADFLTVNATYLDGDHKEFQCEKSISISGEAVYTSRQGVFRTEVSRHRILPSGVRRWPGGEYLPSVQIPRITWKSDHNGPVTVIGIFETEHPGLGNGMLVSLRVGSEHSAQRIVGGEDFVYSGTSLAVDLTVGSEISLQVDPIDGDEIGDTLKYQLLVVRRDPPMAAEEDRRCSDINELLLDIHAAWVFSLHGVIGESVLVAGIDNALKEIGKFENSVIILDIDADTADVVELIGIMDLFLSLPNDVPVIAYCRRLHGLSAWLTLCADFVIAAESDMPLISGRRPSIYDQESTAGTLAYAVSVAEGAGIDPLLVAALFDPSITIGVSTVSPSTVERLPLPNAARLNSLPLHAVGEGLQLSAHEAMRLQIIDAVTSKPLDDYLKSLGVILPQIDHDLAAARLREAASELRASEAAEARRLQILEARSGRDARDLAQAFNKRKSLEGKIQALLNAKPTIDPRSKHFSKTEGGVFTSHGAVAWTRACDNLLGINSRIAAMISEMSRADNEIARLGSTPSEAAFRTSTGITNTQQLQQYIRIESLWLRQNRRAISADGLVPPGNVR